MINLLNSILFIFLGTMVVYVTIFLFISGLSKKQLKITDIQPLQPRKMAILVPCYKEDEIIESTAQSLLALNYPDEYYDIFVIADSLKLATIEALRKLNIRVFIANFEKSTKAKSINLAFKSITGHYDIAIIMDADNILQKDFLIQINASFTEGNTAIQGQRVAKNLDSSFSILDGISEILNNKIFRKGPATIGLSSSLIGSGMAFSYELIEALMTRVDAVGGFDKVLQAEIVKRNIKIVYLENAIVFDEKIPHGKAFSNQRRRWLSSQFIYLRKFFVVGLSNLLKGNFDFFNLAVVHNIILPRIITFRDIAYIVSCFNCL